MTDHRYDVDGGGQSETESRLRQLLSTGTVGERREAALSVVESAQNGLARETIAALEERVQADPDGDVRQFSIEALGLADAGDLETVSAALMDRNEWVRAEAVVALSRLAYGTWTPLLQTLLDADESGWVRRNALIALAKADAADPSTLLRVLREDPHPGVREYAAAYLRSVDTEVTEVVTHLSAVLARDQDAFVRAKAASSLGELGTDRAIEALQAHGVTDHSDDVRRAAERAVSIARGMEGNHLAVDEQNGERCRSDKRSRAGRRQR